MLRCGNGKQDTFAGRIAALNGMLVFAAVMVEKGSKAKLELERTDG